MLRQVKMAIMRIVFIKSMALTQAKTPYRLQQKLRRVEGNFVTLTTFEN